MTHIFIFNPFSKGGSSKKLRLSLSEHKDLRYFIFNIMDNMTYEDVVSQVLRIFDNEKLRIYCCGGSDTIRNIINCFDKLGADLTDYEFAFYPCGITNDFLKVFGREEEHFTHVSELVNGTVIDIDYIRTNYGIALNTVSVGLDADYMYTYNHYKENSVFGSSILSVASALKTFVAQKAGGYEIAIDDKKMKIMVHELIFGNGSLLGGFMLFSPKRSLTSGKLSYLMIPKKNVIGKLAAVYRTSFGKQDVLKKQNRTGECTGFTIRRSDGQPFNINFDGDVVDKITECSARVIHKGLHFVIPKDIEGV